MGDAYRDGKEALSAQLDDLVARRDALDEDLALVRRDIADLERRLGISLAPTPGYRGCIFFLAVPLGLGVGWLAMVLCCPAFTHAKLDSAKVGAQAVRQAAELYQNTEDDVGCPILERLVAAKKLDPKKTEDPWGRPYLVECTADEVRVTSAGKDGVFFSLDDIRADFGSSDIKRVADLQ